MQEDLKSKVLEVLNAAPDGYAIVVREYVVQQWMLLALTVVGIVIGAVALRDGVRRLNAEEPDSMDIFPTLLTAFSGVVIVTCIVVGSASAIAILTPNVSMLQGLLK